MLRWAFLTTILASALLSCQNLFVGQDRGSQHTDSAEAGSIRIAFGGQLGAHTLLPSVDMDVESYDLVGHGPNGAAFDEPISTGSVTMTGIVPGPWTITVYARNAAGQVIGNGDGQVVVSSGQTSALSIEVEPLPGDGTLALSVSWPAGDLAAPSITGSVIPNWGDPVALAFTIETDGYAVAAPVTLPGGYYRLAIQIREGDHLAVGAVEVARIVTDATTNGTIAFSAVNQAGGNVTVNVTQGMDEPLTVAIAGGTDEIVEGQSAVLTASIGESDVEATYEWYLNGALASTEATFAVPDDLERGAYRVDLVAVGIGVDRLGSAHTDFRVVSLFDPIVVQASAFTLSWDPPTAGADVGSYNVYYRARGASDWQLLGSAPASPTPSFTITSADLDYGVYDLAVTSVGTDGLESDIHSSLDESADPNGWFLDWRAP